MKAFEQLSAPVYPKAYNYARKLTRQAATAEDLVQTAFLVALERFHQFQRGTNFAGWVMTILRNTFLNHCRVRKREVSTAAATGAEQLPARESGAALLDPDDMDALKRHLPDYLVRAYSALPDAFRLPFHLVTFHGLTYHEISDRLDLPMGTVMSRLFRARQMLRRELCPT